MPPQECPRIANAVDCGTRSEIGAADAVVEVSPINPKTVAAEAAATIIRRPSVVLISLPSNKAITCLDSWSELPRVVSLLAAIKIRAARHSPAHLTMPQA